MSVIFRPLKVLGLYSSNVPLYLYENKSKENFIYSAIGRSYNIFRLVDLALVGTSEPLPSEITSICGLSNKVYCSEENKLYSFINGKKIHKSYAHEGSSKWKKTLALNVYLCGLDDENKVIVFCQGTNKALYTYQGVGEIIDIIELKESSSIVLLIVYKNGLIQLLDIKIGKLILSKEFSNKKFTTVIQCPNFMTIGLGCADGSVIFYNLKFDNTTKISQYEGGVSRLCIYDDKGKHVVIIGTEFGNMSAYTMIEAGNKSMWTNVWSKRKVHMSLISDIRVVYEGDYKKQYLLTSGDDNCLRLWQFSGACGSPQEKISRSGHNGEIRSAVWWQLKQDDSWRIITGGVDGRVRDHKTTGATECKMLGSTSTKPIKEIACNAFKAGHWSCIVACHDRLSSVSNWTYHEKPPHPLLTANVPKHAAHYAVTSVAIDHSGDYVIAGYENGTLALFNLQSGLERGLLMDAHSGPINKVLVLPWTGYFVTCGKDYKIRRWRIKITFRDQSFINDFDMLIGIHEPISMSADPSGGGMVVSTADKTIHLITSNNTGLHFSRSFPGPMDRSNQSFKPAVHMCLSKNSNLLIAAYSNLIRVFDYVNMKLIDHFRMNRPITSLALSPNVENFLAFSLEGDKGINVWSNRLSGNSCGVLKDLKEISIGEVEGVHVDGVDLDEEDSESEEDSEDEEADESSESGIDEEKEEIQQDPITINNLTLCRDISKLDAIFNSHINTVKNELATVGVVNENNVSFFMEDYEEDVSGKIVKKDMKRKVDVIDVADDIKEAPEEYLGAGKLKEMLEKYANGDVTHEKIGLLLDCPCGERDLLIQIKGLSYDGLYWLFDVILKELSQLRRVDLCIVLAGVVLERFTDQLLEVDKDKVLIHSKQKLLEKVGEVCQFVENNPRLNDFVQVLQKLSAITIPTK